jgi:hypothetical protein
VTPTPSGSVTPTPSGSVTPTPSPTPTVPVSPTPTPKPPILPPTGPTEIILGSLAVIFAGLFTYFFFRGRQLQKTLDQLRGDQTDQPEAV